MEIRLNKLLSDAGLCSRREADRFIEMGRVTINGKKATVGQKADTSDVIMLDDVKVDSLHATEHARTGSGRTRGLIFGGESPRREKKAEKKTERKAERKDKVRDKETGETTAAEKKKPSKLRPGKYVKYNKYAAARKAAKMAEKSPEKPSPDKDQTSKKPRR
jgi:ribosomal 50S subunit-recycling heat shock protein